jgi:hypothetical protein
MNMKRIIAILLMIASLLALCACGDASVPPATEEPQITQMRTICELATMDCYYHNVAKYYEKDADKGILGFGKKDKKFWVEYSGEVTIGLDATLVALQVSGDQVTITIPPAKVLGAKVYSDSLTTDSYIIDKDSADITAEDQTRVFENAQADMLAQASNDHLLLFNAQQRAQMLLEDYVTNIGNAIGVTYQINWIYLDENGKPIDSTVVNPQPDPTDSATTPNA